MTLSGAFSGSKPQIPLPPELPRNRSTLDDAHHLAAKPILDHGEFIAQVQAMIRKAA